MRSKHGFFKTLILGFFSILLLSGCTQVELASHMMKTVYPPKPPASKGLFKVGNPYKIDGRWYYPKEDYSLTETGIASWYGPKFHGKMTANGEIFDKRELTAAHRTLQMPSLVRVTNLDNGRSLIVRVNDRGPYSRGRILDLSEKAAELLGFKNKGTAKVKIQVLKKESLQIAEAAKNGIDTSGYEVAANRGTLRAPSSTESYRVASVEKPPSPPAGVPKIEPIKSEILTTPAGAGDPMKGAIPGHVKNGVFYPDALVTEMPVTPSNIYIQAGSFTVEDNAVRLAKKLASFHKTDVFPIQVADKSFYRVRLGPLSNVDSADKMLSTLINNGYDDTIIVVE